MRTRMINGRNVTPPTPTPEEVIAVVNGLAKADGLKPIDFERYGAGYTIKLSDEVNELHYEFLQVKDEAPYLHDVHPAKVILQKIYDLLLVAEKENNDGVKDTIKRVEQRTKNDTMIKNEVKKLEDKFLEDLIALEYKTEGLDRTVTVDRLVREKITYSEIHQGVLKLRDEKESA